MLPFPFPLVRIGYFAVTPAWNARLAWGVRSHRPTTAWCRRGERSWWVLSRRFGGFGQRGEVPCWCVRCLRCFLDHRCWGFVSRRHLGSGSPRFPRRWSSQCSDAWRPIESTGSWLPFLPDLPWVWPGSHWIRCAGHPSPSRQTWRDRVGNTYPA